MKTLDRKEVLAWCQNRSVNVTDDGYLFFDTRERRCIAIELPEKPYKLVYLANALLPYTESDPFQGALLWIRQWGVWNEWVERVGLRVIEVMRLIRGDTKSLQEAPGYLFEAQELLDLAVCFLQPLLIGWDAFLVPESADYIVATSHDETTFVLTRTVEIHQRMLARLQSWNPREDPEWYFKLI